MGNMVCISCNKEFTPVDEVLELTCTACADRELGINSTNHRFLVDIETLVKNINGIADGYKRIQLFKLCIEILKLEMQNYTTRNAMMRLQNEEVLTNLTNANQYRQQNIHNLVKQINIIVNNTTPSEECANV